MINVSKKMVTNKISIDIYQYKIPCAIEIYPNEIQPDPAVNSNPVDHSCSLNSNPAVGSKYGKGPNLTTAYILDPLAAVQRLISDSISINGSDLTSSNTMTRAESTLDPSYFLLFSRQPTSQNLSLSPFESPPHSLSLAWFI